MSYHEPGLTPEYPEDNPGYPLTLLGRLDEDRAGVWVPEQPVIRARPQGAPISSFPTIGHMGLGFPWQASEEAWQEAAVEVPALGGHQQFGVCWL
jgi:hypothetical protein